MAPIPRPFASCAQQTDVSTLVSYAAMTPVSRSGSFFGTSHRERQMQS
jgi:hypothetical protein